MRSYRDSDGSFVTSSTTQNESLEIRHVELNSRYQPYWGVVRPFVELEFGLAVLWAGSELESDQGKTIASRDRQRSAAAVYGGSIGLDWRLMTFAPSSGGTTALMLTTAVKRWYTTPMLRPDYSEDDNFAQAGSARSRLGLWLPYIALTLAIDSRVKSRAPPRQ